MSIFDRFKARKKTCPKTGKVVNRQFKPWLAWLLPIAGLVSLIWFLIRVIPKPSRAAYPCQRVAFPLASGFVIWLTGITAAAAAFKKARLSFTRRRYALALTCAAASIAAIFLAASLTNDSTAPAAEHEANKPIGTARGIFPGRVVWAHDPQATKWQGPDHGHHWQPENTDQARVAAMLRSTIRTVAGGESDAQAWDRLFKYFNRARGKGDVGYKSGEKITIKANLVGFIGSSRAVNTETYELENWRDYMNTNPQLINALLGELTAHANVRQSDITITDTLARIPHEYYRIITAQFPDVRFVDHAGKFGRTRTAASDVALHWSCSPDSPNQDYLPKCLADADYIINLANLKAHTGAGVTLCAKNHYGSLVRTPVADGYYNMHPAAFAKTTDTYRPLVDLMGHSQLGGKTLLYLIDALYCGIHPRDHAPRKFNTSPFNGHWTSSVFASLDPVAIDSVGFDFLYAEYDSFPRNAGVDDYLHEAAQAGNPPSGTFYDPDHKGNVARLKSLGVHEHWNNPEQKQYSRNLRTGEGIELVKAGSHKPPSIIAPGAEVVKLADGFKFTEGPAVDREGNVYFTDQPNNKILKWSVDGKLSTFHDSPGRANGLYFDRRGKLLACADLNNELWSIDMDGKHTVLVNGYKGKKLNGPNDLWERPDGGIYFTDPFYKRPYWDRGPMEQDGQHVYYLSPDRNRLVRVTDDLVQPNGIIGTPDGKYLYVADIGDKKTYRYKINEDGSITDKKLFCSMGSDGMTIDNEGNIYLTGRGVTVFNPEGEKIQHIPIDAGWTANVTFGGKDRHTLFITAQKSLFALQMRVKGVK